MIGPVIFVVVVAVMVALAAIPPARRRPQPPAPRPAPAPAPPADPPEALITRARILATTRQYDLMLAERLLGFVDQAPDPANPGATLRLVIDVYGAITTRRGRVLLVTNARTGEHSRAVAAIPVPPTMTDPVAAAAWTYDADPDTYRALARRT